MKIIFTKSSSSPNLLHVYEHIISARIHGHMRSVGYYCYIDYALKARTFNNGHCFLELDLYDKNSLPTVLEQNLSGIKFNDTDIQRAYYQVLAEDGRLYGFSSPTYNLLDEMVAMHALSWNLTKSNVTNSKLSITDDRLRVYDDPIEIKDYAMSLKIELDNFSPIFAKDILKAIGHNLQVHLSNERGYYRELMEVGDNSVELGFRVVGAAVNIERDLSYIKSMANELVRAKSFRRLSATLNDKEFGSLVATLESSFEAWSVDCLKN
jgi:hypothetical protein